MKKKTKFIIAMACLAVACVGLAACATDSELDLLEKEGCKVSVTYDSNGGNFSGRSGVSVVNMFNPDNFADSDGDGKVEISLKSSDPVLFKDVGAPTKNGYFFAGWYKERELVTVDGQPVDDYGNVLERNSDGLYYIKGTTTRASQAYAYGGLWDFENDKIEVDPKGDGYKLTLYAAWVPYYQFNYYCQTDNSTEWTLLGSTSFNYSETQSFIDEYAYTAAANAGATYDCDKIWVPAWSGENDTGEMVHTHPYSNNTTYTFPSYKEHTFLAAYTDRDCESEISGELTHSGSLVYNKSTQKLEVNNLVQDIYVKFENGVQYRVTTAEQFISFAAKSNAASVYTIMAQELDFTDKNWSSALSNGEFSGKIIGNNCVFKNISARNTDASVAYGGLFGKISANATIENITFSNVTYDMAGGTTANLPLNASAYFGVFAGEIEDGAKVSGIAVENSTLKIGHLLPKTYAIGLACGRGAEGVTFSGMSIVLVGEATRNENEYLYYVTAVSVDEETGKVVPTIELSSTRAIARDTETFTVYPVQDN